MSEKTKYWKSLEEWRKDPEFLKIAEREFLRAPFSPEQIQKEEGWMRREFLKLMGASLALGFFGCVRRPAQKIVPYVKRPENLIPGVPTFYTSCIKDALEGFGILVKTREGRPIKIEGNPDHPLNQGGLSARAHAHLLSLYDPDRVQNPKKSLFNEKRTNRDVVSVSWEKADEEILGKIKKGRTVILSPTSVSPTEKSLVKDFQKAFSSSYYLYDSLDFSSLRSSQKRSYGKGEIPRYRIEKADYILSLGADFLGTYLAPVEMSKGFSKRRKPGALMNKLVVFEPNLSLTGTNADERHPIKASQLPDFALSLIHEIVVAKGYISQKSSVVEFLKKYKKKSKLDIKPHVISHIAKDLVSNQGRSLVMTGGMAVEGEDSLTLHQAVNYLNHLLGNVGKTVDFSRPYEIGKGSQESIRKLIHDISRKKIDTLILKEVNPLYHSPLGRELKKALRKVPFSIYIGEKENETSKFCNYFLPLSHQLESWGDMQWQKGVLSIKQPTIRPLYKTRSFEEMLVQWVLKAKKPLSFPAKDAYSYLRSYWKFVVFPKSFYKRGFERFWTDTLKKGAVSVRVKKAPKKTFQLSQALRIFRRYKPSPSSKEMLFYPTVGLAEGSLSNVSWIQEFPDPVSKICWDNYLNVSYEFSKKYKLQEGDMVRVYISGGEKEVPVHIQPGMEKDTVSLAVGYGRKGAGEIAEGVGVKVYDLSVLKRGKLITSCLPFRLEKTGKSYPLANVQGHHNMESRQLVVETTLKDYMKNPSSNIHKHKVFSLWDPHKYKGIKWGMTIDLNSCTGCGTCVLACQSENNIPVVGKRYVLQGREMHWIRVDRYYVGKKENPDVVHQPVVCMHCDNAPCETVCPVLATVHSEEGTNDMIYNRCVGTRYCSNNCPYKVRRFNWFRYTDMRSPLHMALNPEVTVRSRGVMEKCTFCIHRIKEERNNSRREDKKFVASQVKTACQESCPADCISFGDLNDKKSKVRKKFDGKRSYALLEELNVKPSVKYQSKVRNVAELKGEDPHKGHG